jgi:hypothetical protein
MIIYCETCKATLLETESDRVALDLKDLHEFEEDHKVNLYIDHRGQRIRRSSLVETISVDI